jgi:hypothetical protein
VSRKISLDTLVEFAVAQGSQWIFITPHDIRSVIQPRVHVSFKLRGFVSATLGYSYMYVCLLSMVKAGDRIKKQQMAAPRG